MNENMNIIEDVVEVAKDVVENVEVVDNGMEIAKALYGKGVKRGVAGTVVAALLGAGAYYGVKWFKNRKKQGVIDAEFKEVENDEAQEEAK